MLTKLISIEPHRILCFFGPEAQTLYTTEWKSGKATDSIAVAKDSVRIFIYEPFCKNCGLEENTLLVLRDCEVARKIWIDVGTY